MKLIRYWLLLLSFVVSFVAGPTAVAEQLCHDALTATAPDHYYKNGKDSTVTDTHNHLMWQRCSMGQQWQAGECQGKAQQASFNEAINQAMHHEEAGYSDWRLPTIHELSTLAELRCYQPAINLTFFPNTPAGDFWTSTIFVNNLTMAWLVHFQYGENHTAKKTFKAAVRLVRDIAP